MIKCLRKENHHYDIQYYVINDKLAPKFNSMNSFYYLQKELNLPFNIYQNGKWGIHISNADISKLSGFEQLLLETISFGSISGIFNLTVVLHDQYFLEQTTERFYKSLIPKAIATTHLDLLSRKMCPNLEYFVVFSSVACGFGNPGQTNYGMSNAIMERIIEFRCNDKLPGKAIQWGAIDDVGSAYKLMKSKSSGQNLAGFGLQTINSCLDVLDQLLMSNEPIVASYVIAHQFETKKNNLITSVLNMLSINDINLISRNSTMTELGIDSMLSTEIMQFMKYEYNIDITVDNLKQLTAQNLVDMSNEIDK